MQNQTIGYYKGSRTKRGFVMERELLHEIDLEISDTPELREKGLMMRDNIPRNSGMLFDFGKPTNMTFWGKNTLQPLDIAFLDSAGQILQIKNIKPMSRDSITSPRPLQHAVEVPHGVLHKHGIGPGCFCKHNGNNKMRFYRKIILDD